MPIGAIIISLVMLTSFYQQTVDDQYEMKHTVIIEETES